MFGKSNGNASDTNRESPSAQEVKRPTVGHSTASEAASCIRSGLSIVGKIVGQGALSILGHVEGEVHASAVQIGDGAQVVGNIVSEELAIGGRVKGKIHANRVKLNNTAVVEGDISIIALWQSRRMRNSRECLDDRKMPSIPPRLVPAKR